MKLDWITLDTFVVDCVIGVLDSEQRRHQPLDIQLKLGLDLDGAMGGKLDASVNYATVMEHVSTIVQHGRWRLLESIGGAVSRFLLAPPCVNEGRAQIEEVRIVLRKPEILGDRATPGIQMSRKRSWCDLQTQQIGPTCSADILQETRHAGAYRILIEPHGRWSIPPGVALQVITGPARIDGTDREPGSAIARGAFEVENPSDDAIALLAVGSPLPGAL